MPAYIEVPSAHGSKLIIEAESAPISIGTDDAALAGKVSGIADAAKRVTAGATEIFENALKAVTLAHAEAFQAALGAISSPPSEATLEFGLKISAELGAVVVSKVATEANYTIKLTWKDVTRPQTK